MTHPAATKGLARLVAVLAAFLLIAAACGDDSSGDSDASTTTSDGGTDTTETDEAALEGELVGTFAIDPASCAEADVSGSYFRMIQPGGTIADGPFVPNTDSSCADNTLTPLMPGADGGLVTGSHQPAPDPAFDAEGNALSDEITEPTPFLAVGFSVATEEENGLVTITAADGTLSGDLSAWTAYYGDLVFQQGAPKTDGSMPGLTSEVTGTIDPETGEYTLEWSSQILGGAFNDFTGVWHLEGTFA